jgi:hypothetical protein
MATLEQLLGGAVNPLTGKPYAWTDQAGYGSLDELVNNPAWSNYGKVQSGDEAAFDPVWNQQDNEAAKQFLGQGATVGYQDDGRMQRNVIKDASGNVVQGFDPTYHTPTNFWKDAFLPMASFALGAPQLGALGGIPIPAGTPTLAGLLGSQQPAQSVANSANSANSGVSQSLADLVGQSAPAEAAGSGVQSALNELVGQSMVPQGAFGVNGAVQDALDELVGLNMSRPDYFGNLAESLGGTPYVPTPDQSIDVTGTKQAPIPEVPNAVYPDFQEPQPEIPNAVYPDFQAPQPEIPNAIYPDGAGTGATGAPSVVPNPNATTGVMDWLKENGKWLSPLLGAGMGLLDGGGSSSGGYKDSGYRPTINRGGWSPSATKAPSVTPNIGLLNIPKTGVENAGLWRFLNR